MSAGLACVATVPCLSMQNFSCLVATLTNGIIYVMYVSYVAVAPIHETIAAEKIGLLIKLNTHNSSDLNQKVERPAFYSGLELSCESGCRVSATEVSQVCFAKFVRILKASYFFGF